MAKKSPAGPDDFRPGKDWPSSTTIPPCRTMIPAKALQRADAKKSEELEEIVERSDIKAGGPSSARTPGRLLQRHEAGKTAILSIAGIDIPKRGAL